MADMKIKIPLAIKIPTDYAEDLGVHPSHLSHVNAGRRLLTIPQCRAIMVWARCDFRLSGLTLLMLRPELKEVQNHF